MAKKERDPFDIEVGRRLRQAREAANMPQVDLARQLGFERRTPVYRYEAGVRGIPLEKLVAISQLLRVSTDWLLTGALGVHGLPGSFKYVATRGARALGVIKPARDVIPKVMRELYTSGRLGDVSDADEQFLVEYIVKNPGKGELDVERALLSDRFGRDGSEANLLALQKISARQQHLAGVRRAPEVRPENDVATSSKKHPARRKDDRS